VKLPAERTQWLDFLRTQRKLSPHTTDNYGRDLTLLLDYLAAEGVQEAQNVGHLHIRKLASRLHSQGQSPRSIARRLSAWRGFFEWLAQQGQELKRNPVDGVRAPRRDKSLPKVLSPDDAVRVVSQNRPGADANAADQLCNRAMFELLYSSGLRVSELAGLDVVHQQTRAGHESAGWLNHDHSEVTVTGKGNKRRSVPVGSHARVALAAWLAARAGQVIDPAPQHQAALFINTRGRRITPAVVQMRLRRHALELGIPARVHPHVMRHCFASHVLQSSGDLRAVQEMLGHASIASTQVYTSLDFQHLAKVYDAAHPRAKKTDGD
jgi:integrase/recombinase XerC